MQKLISKYALAAHLGLLTAAPLFLYPLFGLRPTCTVLMVLAVFAAMWVMMEPSRRRGEMLHDARGRVVKSVFTSPLFYALLVFAGYSLTVHFNSGLALAFDAGTGGWSIGLPRFPGVPASVAGMAFPALAAAVAALAAGPGLRFALGRDAREAYLFVFSLIAGLAGLALAVTFLDGGNARVAALVKAGVSGGSFIGCAFGLATIAGVAAIPGAFEREWTAATALLVPAIGGSFVGMFLCSTAVEIAIFSGAAVALAAAGLVYSVFEVRGPGALKVLAVFLIAASAGIAFLVALTPEWAGARRIDGITKLRFLPRDFLQIRAAVDSAVVKAIPSAPWTGTGVGTLGWDLRFNARPEDWAVIPPATTAASDGWTAARVERGLVGALAFLLVALALYLDWLWRFGRGLIASFVGRRRGERHLLLDPQAWAGPVGAVAAVAAAWFGEAPFSAATVLAAMLLSAFSINVLRSSKNGGAGPKKARRSKGNG